VRKAMRISVSGISVIDIHDFPFDPEGFKVSNSDLSNNGVDQDSRTQGFKRWLVQLMAVYILSERLSMLDSK